MLIAEVKRQNKPYGLYLRPVTGGYTTTQRRGLQAFTVIPLMVYRVFADGRPDELVRGVDIVGTPLVEFRQDPGDLGQAGSVQRLLRRRIGATCRCRPVRPRFWFPKSKFRRKQHSQDRPPFLGRPTEYREPRK